MKRALFAAVLIFSLVLNAAVAATVGWYVWKTPSVVTQQPSTGEPLSQADARAIASLWPRQGRQNMMQMHQEVNRKKAEVLDMIARNPDDINILEPKVKELIALRSQMERQALSRIRTIMAELPPEKRQAFLSFLTTRACMGAGMGRRQGRGMGMGMGGRGGMCGPRGSQVAPRGNLGQQTGSGSQSYPALSE